MHNDIQVRVGTPEDIDGLMEIAMAASKENGFVDPSPRKLLMDIWPALNRDKGIVGIIGKPGEKVEGAILLRIGETWYSEQMTLEERAIFISPDFRSAKGGRARKLVDFAKKTADELGLPLMIGVLSNHRTEGKVRLYRRIFGEPTGAYWLYGATTGLDIAREAAE
jgi:GNAT superfamily N-acetyltransferase